MNQVPSRKGFWGAVLLQLAIEAWFVPEGAGQDLEDRARRTGVTATFSVLPDGRSFLVDVR